MNNTEGKMSISNNKRYTNQNVPRETSKAKGYATQIPVFLQVEGCQGAPIFVRGPAPRVTRKNRSEVLTAIFRDIHHILLKFSFVVSDIVGSCRGQPAETARGTVLTTGTDIPGSGPGCSSPSEINVDKRNKRY